MGKCRSHFGHLFQKTGITHNGNQIKLMGFHRVLHKNHMKHIHWSTCVFCGESKRKIECDGREE